MAKKRTTPPRARPTAGKPRDPEIDPEVKADLDERQKLAEGGRQELLERLADHNAQTPELAGGDVDADWDLSLEGSEDVGGHAPTPDQDQVEEIGRGAGLTYADDEPLNYDKVAARDRHRWELNPASAEDSVQSARGLDEDDLYDLGYPHVVSKVFENDSEATGGDDEVAEETQA